MKRTASTMLPYDVKLLKDFTSNERKLLLNLKNVTLTKVTKLSKKEYDIDFEGIEYTEMFGKIIFSSYLPLHIIKKSDWTNFTYLSDYPEMVLEGDWSGIRDSSEDKIWKMFENVLETLK